MQGTLQFMTLREILEQREIRSSRELADRTGLSIAQASNLWHAKAGVGRFTMQLLHEKLGIPYEELAQVDKVGRLPRRRPPEEE
jgi:transcriptional regulator with XRE-family HTH domain